MPNTQTARQSGAEQRGFFALLRALADSGLDLAHNTARMAASEGRMVLHRVTARLCLLLAGMLFGAIGLLLALAGGALGLARLAGMDPWLALSIVGVATLAIGAFVTMRAIRRLDAPDLGFQATLAEFEADMQALRAARGGHEDETP